MDIRIYLTNLAQYNQCKLVGKWLDLPLDEENLIQELHEILGNDEEYFITDYEAPFKIDEYENPFELNELVWKLEKLDEYDHQKIFYLLEVIGCTREEALEKYEDVIFYSDMTLEDVASELVEEGVFGDLTNNIKGYIDYEKLARDLSIDGYYETEAGTFWYQ
jgi:antirestriction protein